MQASLDNPTSISSGREAGLVFEMHHGMLCGSPRDRLVWSDGLRNCEGGLQPSLAITSPHHAIDTLHPNSAANAPYKAKPLLLTPPPRALIRDIQRISFHGSFSAATERNLHRPLPFTSLHYAHEGTEPTIVPRVDDQFHHENNVPPSRYPHPRGCGRMNNFCEEGPLFGRPQFLSKEAELFWNTFGNADPAQIGSILYRTDKTGSTIASWLAICSATADPIIRESVGQLHILNQEISSVLTESDRPYVTQWNVYLRSELAWRYEFSAFRSQIHANSWLARFRKLSLLHREYQSIEARLELEQSHMRSKPELVMKQLHSIKEWRSLLDAEMETTSKSFQNRDKLAEQKRKEVDGTSYYASAVDKSGCSWHKNSAAKDQLGQSSWRSTDTRNKNFIGEGARRRIRSCTRLRAYGTQRAAYAIASCLALFATIATSVSVWRYTPTSTSLYADSNFWSTCSQTFLGLGGIYCLLIPILQEAKLDVSRPKLFKMLLVASIIAAVAAVAVYHYHVQTSLVLALISGLTALAATLLLIKDAGNKIIDQTAQVEWLEDEVVRLRAHGDS